MSRRGLARHDTRQTPSVTSLTRGAPSLPPHTSRLAQCRRRRAQTREQRACHGRDMSRPLRLDYPGATHHIFTRGVARSAIAHDSGDYERALDLLERAASRFELQCHAWCYLPNHSHLLVTAELGNISQAMHWIGTCTAQAFNQRHQRTGHLYQGRFGSRLVDDDSYFLELARYLPLNPVRGGLCSTPCEWPWSSYAATVGLEPRPSFLDSSAFVAMLGSIDAYTRWVDDSASPSLLDDRGMPLPPPRAPLETLLTDDSLQSI